MIKKFLPLLIFLFISCGEEEINVTYSPKYKVDNRSHILPLGELKKNQKVNTVGSLYSYSTTDE